jgi:acyl-CoA thioesterase
VTALIHDHEPDSGGLADDVALRETPQGLEAVLNADWSTFGPCGGYLAAIALHAAGRGTGRARPASISCTFLRMGGPGPVGVVSRTLSDSRRASSVGVSLMQDGKTLMEAFVWTIDDGLPGPGHDAVPMPDVARPESLREVDELIPAERARPFASWRKGVEERTLSYDFDNWRRPYGEPRILSWFRFRPKASFRDPFVDAARALLLIDTMQFPAAGGAYEELPPYVAQSLDLSVHFHRTAPDQEWLLCDATAPIAGDGLLNGRTRIWGADGALFASGGQQMLCRRI